MPDVSCWLISLMPHVCIVYNSHLLVVWFLTLSTLTKGLAQNVHALNNSFCTSSGVQMSDRLSNVSVLCFSTCAWHFIKEEEEENRAGIFTFMLKSKIGEIIPYRFYTVGGCSHTAANRLSCATVCGEHCHDIWGNFWFPGLANPDSMST